MKLKQAISVLLALMLLFSLAACTLGGGTPIVRPKDTLDNSKAEKDDYTLAADALQYFIDNPDLNGYAKFIGGNLAADEVYEYVRSYELFYAQSEGSFFEDLKSSLTGYTVQDSTDLELTKDMEKRTVSDLETFRAQLEENIETSREETDHMEQKAWESYAAQRGMSVDELKQYADDLIDAMQALLDKLEDVEVDNVHVVTVSLKGAESRTRDVTILYADGAWFTADLFDFPV